MPSADAERYLLVKGDQGLGNRILSLLSALLLARLTGRRLVVDWRDPFYASGGRDAFSELLELRGAAPGASSLPIALPAAVPDTESVRPAVWRGHLHEDASAMRARIGGAARGPRAWQPLCVDLDHLELPERVLVFVCYHERIDDLRRYLTGDLAPLRRLSTDDILRLLWAESLTLAAPLQARVDAYRRDHLEGGAVGVHVRASDRRTRVRALDAAVSRLVRSAPGRRRVFVASDNEDVVRRYRARFRDVVATDKWYPPPGEPMHGHPSRPDPTRDAADALVDLHLLAACGALVIDSRSSFGRLAALRSSAAQSRVVDVHPGRHLPGILRKGLLRVRDEVVGRRLARGS